MIIVIVEKIKEYLKSITNAELDMYNDYTIDYSRMRRKVATDILNKIEELENT